MVHVAELEAIQASLEKQVATYQGQLTAEQTRSKALDTSKREVRSASNLYSVYTTIPKPRRITFVAC